MTASQPQEGRKLVWGAFALFIGVPLAVAALTAFNFTRSFEVDARAAAQEDALRLVERRIRSGAGGALGADTSGIYLRAASSTLAKAELQQRVVKLIDQTSGRLIETQGGDELTEPSDNHKIQLRVTLDATNDSLLNFLYEVETGVPLLVVEQINIRKLPARNETPDVDPPLRVTLLLQGQWKESAP